MPTKS